MRQLRRHIRHPRSVGNSRSKLCSIAKHEDKRWGIETPLTRLDSFFFTEYSQTQLHSAPTSHAGVILWIQLAIASWKHNLVGRVPVCRGGLARSGEPYCFLQLSLSSSEILLRGDISSDGHPSASISTTLEARAITSLRSWQRFWRRTLCKRERGQNLLHLLRGSLP